MTHVQVFFRKSLSKATFERKLSSVSLPLDPRRQGQLPYQQATVTAQFIMASKMTAVVCLLQYDS